MKDELHVMTLGGDDYITKPFRLDELRVHVASAMRRRDMYDTSAQIIKKGGLTLDIIARQAFVEGEDLMVSQKEFSILVLFIQYENSLMSADYLYERVWGQPMNEDNQAIRKLISRITPKLVGSGFSISAEYGKGYRFEKE